MKIETADLGNSVIRLKLTGRLDINGAAMAEIPIGQAAKGCRHLVIDMSEVSYVASLGVRHLVMAAKTLDRSGGALVLFSLTDPVAEILDSMGLSDLLPVAESERAALALAAPEA